MQIYLYTSMDIFTYTYTYIRNNMNRIQKYYEIYCDIYQYILPRIPETTPSIASCKLFGLLVGQGCSQCPPKESDKSFQNSG